MTDIRGVLKASSIGSFVVYALASVLLATALGVATLTMARAELPYLTCSDRTTAIEQLSRDFSEEIVAMGLSSDGKVVEVFMSPSGSFTVVVTDTNGISCALLSGQSWEDVPPPLDSST